MSAGSGSDRVRARDPDQHRGAARAAWRGTPPASPRAARSPRSRSRRRRPSASRTASAVASGDPGPEHGVRRAELARDVQLRRRRVDRDDRLGAHRDRGHHRREADAAAADHRDAVAGPDSGGPPDRADAGRHRAADEPGDLERHVVAGSARTSARARRTPRRRSRGTSSGRRARRRARAASSRPSARRCPSPATRSSRAAAGCAGTRRTRRRTAPRRARRGRPPATRVTPAPTASTTPAPSCPSTAGQRVSAVPSIALKSEWQTPLACSRTSTSPGPGGASSSSCTSSGAARARSRTAARILITPPRTAAARSSSIGMWQRIRWPGSTSTQRRLGLLADRAELARAARVEDAARRRVGGARDLALEPDPLASAAVDRRHRREQRLGVRVVRARRRRPRPGRAPSAGRGRARRSGRRGSARRRGRAR